ncbi:MAG: hypothetical protein FJ293_06865 [Planctomycetes bacterium]|nr:hypothetical protein [Planctomycetota bacterium]
MTRSARLGAALLLLAPLLAAGGGDDGAAAPAAPARDAEALRAERLALQRTRCDELAAAVDQFGHLDTFAGAARQLLTRVDERFVAVRDGVFTDIALENWLDWNEPRQGGPVLPSLDTEATDHPYRAIVELNRELRARGIDFLLVSFPTRPSLYPELALDLPSMTGFAGFCPATPRFARALIDAGVEVLYLAPEFVAERYGVAPDGTGTDTADQLFLRYNQHWTPRGAELAARKVAEYVAGYPWFERGPGKEGTDFTLRTKDVEVAIVWGGTPKGAKPERCKATQVLPRPGRRLDSVRPSSPIVLLSGSFADFHMVSSADFTAQLYRHTGWPVDKVNPKGGIEDACRVALSQKSEADWKRKKLVIWMVAEQAFKRGQPWRPIPIFGRTDPAADPARGNDGGAGDGR